MKRLVYARVGRDPLLTRPAVVRQKAHVRHGKSLAPATVARSRDLSGLPGRAVSEFGLRLRPSLGNPSGSSRNSIFQRLSRLSDRTILRIETGRAGCISACSICPYLTFLLKQAATEYDDYQHNLDHAQVLRARAVELDTARAAVNIIIGYSEILIDDMTALGQTEAVHDLDRIRTAE